MIELHASGATLSQAYHAALDKLFAFGYKSHINAWNTDCLEGAITIFVSQPLKEPMISKYFPGGPRELQQYMMEMLDGILDFEVSAGKWHYTYHNRMTDFHGVDQIQFVIDELKKDPTSRRACIVVRDPESDCGSEDPACLQHIQYFIRNNRLDCIATFRSNDALKASFMNMFALIMLQKKLADEIGVEMGVYTHRANNFHCYEKDFDLLHSISVKLGNTLGERFGSYYRADRHGYSYKDDWKEMMDEYIPEIMEQVKKLRERNENKNDKSEVR